MKMKGMWLKVLCIGLVTLFTAVNIPAAEKEVVSQTWGGKHEEAQIKGFHEPFFKETGIKVIPVTAAGGLWGKVASQVKSGHVEWDVINPTDYPAVEAAARKGLLEEIDYSIVNNTKDLVPGAVRKYGVGLSLSDFAFCYNNNVFKGENVPKSWADFYDVNRFPGPRSMHNWGTPYIHFFTALLADGVPADQLTPIDYERAFKVLDRIKSHVKVWYTSGDKGMQVLIDQEAVLASFTDARIKLSQQLGAPITLAWNQNIPVLTYSCVVKGDPNKEAAMRYINFTTRPELQAVYNKYSGSCGTNPKFLNYLDEQQKRLQVVYPDNFKLRVDAMTEKNAAWLADHADEITEKFTAWLAK